MPRGPKGEKRPEALEHYAGGPAEAPSGVGPVTIFNLIQKGAASKEQSA